MNRSCHVISSSGKGKLHSSIVKEQKRVASFLQLGFFFLPWVLWNLYGFFLKDRFPSKAGISFRGWELLKTERKWIIFSRSTLIKILYWSILSSDSIQSNHLQWNAVKPYYWPSRQHDASPFPMPHCSRDPPGTYLKAFKCSQKFRGLFWGDWLLSCMISSS